MNYFNQNEPINKKNKNVIIYSLYIKEQNEEYFPMVYHSLKTLLSKAKNRNFDIIVFYTFEKEKDLVNYKFWKDFNLIKDFPEVIFIKTEYSKIFSDGYMSKWYHIEKAFEYKYDWVLYLDADTEFLKDPQPLFEYNPNSAYSISEGPTKRAEIVLKEWGILSAAVLIPLAKFKNINNFFSQVIEQREELNNLAKKYYQENKLTLEECSDSCFFNEQYAGQFTLIKNNIEVIDFKKEFQNLILHYSHNFCYEYLPEELITDYVKQVEKNFKERYGD